MMLAKQIQESATMYQVLALYGYKLDRRGRMLCPFHREDTPSFGIYADGWRWKCFGCGAGGDVFSFVMQLFGLTFPQAVLRLAGDLGLSAVETAPGRAQAERLARERRERQAVHSALCRAVDAHFFRLHMYEQEADRLRPKPGDAAMHHDFLAALRGIEQEWAWLDANAWR